MRKTNAAPDAVGHAARIIAPAAGARSSGRGAARQDGVAGGREAILLSVQVTEPVELPAVAGQRATVRRAAAAELAQLEQLAGARPRRNTVRSRLLAARLAARHDRLYGRSPLVQVCEVSQLVVAAIRARLVERVGRVGRNVLARARRSDEARRGRSRERDGLARDRALVGRGLADAFGDDNVESGPAAVAAAGEKRSAVLAVHARLTLSLNVLIDFGRSSRRCEWGGAGTEQG